MIGFAGRRVERKIQRAETEIKAEQERVKRNRKGEK